MIAVCGILTGAMLPGACHVFFGENESLDCREHSRLTLDTDAALFHQIDALFALPTLVGLFGPRISGNSKLILADQGDYVVGCSFHRWHCHICCDRHF